MFGIGIAFQQVFLSSFCQSVEFSILPKIFVYWYVFPKEFLRPIYSTKFSIGLISGLCGRHSRTFIFLQLCKKLLVVTYISHWGVFLKLIPVNFYSGYQSYAFIRIRNTTYRFPTPRKTSSYWSSPYLIIDKRSVWFSPLTRALFFLFNNSNLYSRHSKLFVFRMIAAYYIDTKTLRILTYIIFPLTRNSLRVHLILSCLKFTKHKQIRLSNYRN